MSYQNDEDMSSLNDFSEQVVHFFLIEKNGHL